MGVLKGQRIIFTENLVGVLAGLKLIHTACRAHAVPLPCRAALIHTYHAAPLPFSDSAVSIVKVRMIAGNIRTASPAVLTHRIFRSALLPLFTVVGMDRCEEDVIIACGLYVLAEGEKRNKRRY